MMRRELCRLGFFVLFVVSFFGSPIMAASAEGQIDPAALKRLADRAADTGSDAVVVYLHGTKIFEYHSPKEREPIYIMSCTKSIVGLAVGAAIAEGKIKSIDEPVYDFFPEWNQGRKKLVTIRHLLSMTSGVQNNFEDTYAFPDSLKLALAAEIDNQPGMAFRYNNKAANLLGGIIHVATGERLDAYVSDHFFEPMGIKFWKWERDDAGNAYAFADLALLPEDFAKFGQLLLQRGEWNGHQLVPSSWIDQLGVESQSFEPLYGLLWWRVPTGATGVITSKRLAELAKAAVDPELVLQLKPLVGKKVHSMLEWHRLLVAAMPDWEKRMPVPGAIEPYGNNLPTWEYEGFDGIAALGYLGQYLVVFPKLGLVAVRQIEPFDDYDFMRNRFEDFPDLVRDLVPVSGEHGGRGFVVKKPHLQ